MLTGREYDRVIQEAEQAFTKILESSQVLLNVVQTKSQDLRCNPREERRGSGGGGNREEAGLTNAHSRGEDANADQGDKGCDNLQMERLNQISDEEREANPQLCGSTEQELPGSEAQVSAQDGQFEDGSD